MVASPHQQDKCKTAAEFKFFVMNNDAFGNVFCYSQNSFHTFLRFSGPIVKGYRSFFQLNYSILIYKNIKLKVMPFYLFVNQLRLGVTFTFL